MPTVYNVSEITNILSSTIQRNVLVQGEVEILADSPPNAFFLQHEEKKLRCFIPGGNISRFGSLLTSGNTVVVDGKITLFSRFSQYQITVSDISANGISTNAFSVTEITNKISHLVESTPALQDIQIQGRVLEVFEAVVSNWDLCDIDGSPALRIKCVRPGFINFPVQKENNVCVRGEVGIYPSQSRYEIKVIDPVTEASTPTCQCPGCNSCHPQGGNQSCLPLQNPEYELCPNCYHESPDHEDRVEEAVETYFSNLKVKGFSPETQHEIQMGSDNRKPDVVLIDGDGSFAAIAECKGAGFIGDGIDQLKSYLSATDTHFGIFANRTDRGQWQFYENRRRNRFDQIDRSQFETEIIAGQPIESIREEKDRLVRETEQAKIQLGKEACLLSTQKDHLQSEIATKNQQRMCLLEKIAFLEQDKDRLEGNRNKIKSEREAQREALKKEKEGWQRGVKIQKQLYIDRKKINADLDERIKRKTLLIRELESRLNVTSALESIYGQIEKELKRLDELESEITRKQQLARQDQERHAACERNKVETNQKIQQRLQVSQERESILKQLRVVVNQLKTAYPEQKGQIERHQEQLAQDLRKHRCIYNQLIIEIAQLKETKSKLEVEIREMAQQFLCEKKEMSPVYLQIQVEIDKLIAEKSKLKTEIGHRIYMLLKKKD